jgi:hypothetical protein
MLVGWKPNVGFEEETRENNKVVCVKKTQHIDRAGKTEKYA